MYCLNSAAGFTVLYFGNCSNQSQLFCQWWLASWIKCICCNYGMSIYLLPMWRLSCCSNSYLCWDMVNEVGKDQMRYISSTYTSWYSVWYDESILDLGESIPCLGVNLLLLDDCLYVEWLDNLNSEKWSSFFLIKIARLNYSIPIRLSFFLLYCIIKGWISLM